MNRQTPMLGDEKVILRMFAAAFAGAVFLCPLTILLSGLVYDGHEVLAATISLFSWVLVTLLAFSLLGRTKIFGDANKISLQTTPFKRSLIFSAKLILLMSAFGPMYGIASECREKAAPKEQTISSVVKDIKEGVRVRADTKRLRMERTKQHFSFRTIRKKDYYYSAVVTFEDPQRRCRTELVNSHCFDGDWFLQSGDSRNLGYENETVVAIEVTSLK